MPDTTIFPGLLEQHDEQRDGEPNPPHTTEILGSDIESALDAGNCPWCDEGGFARPQMHARQAHPDKWDEWEA